MENFVIRIGLFGCVSVGKSTLLNAIAGEQLSDTEIKATTMVPQVYQEKFTGCTTDSNIRETNRKANQNAEKQIEDGQFDMKKCTPIVHQIDRLCDLFNEDSTDIKVELHDIPGLNDSCGKSIYFQYVRENIKNYDIIIFMTDIGRGLNNSDELDVLSLLAESMTHSRARMLCLINKCDDIYFDIDQNDLVFEEEEQENIYIKANNILADIARKYDMEVGETKRITPFLPISAENCYIYRALHENPDYDLDPSHKTRLCKNECGNFTWKKMSQHEKNEYFQKIIFELRSDYARKMLDTGYIDMRHILQNIISQNKIEFIKGQIEEELSGIIFNEISNFEQFFLKINFIYHKIEELGVNEDEILLFWNNIKLSIDNHLNYILRISAPVINHNKTLNLDFFDKANILFQTTCMEISGLANKLENYKQYPADFFQFRIKMLASKLLVIYDQLKQINLKDVYRMGPGNFYEFLQFIRSYAPEHFDDYAVFFLKFPIFDPETKFFSNNQTEMIKLFQFIGEHMKSDQKFVSQICVVIAKKFKKCDNNSYLFLDYLIRLKKMIHETIHAKTISDTVYPHPSEVYPRVNRSDPSSSKTYPRVNRSDPHPSEVYPRVNRSDPHPSEVYPRVNRSDPSSSKTYALVVLAEIVDDKIKDQFEYNKYKLLNDLLDIGSPNTEMHFETQLMECIKQRLGG